MKYVLFALVLFAPLHSFAGDQAADAKGIERAVLNYFEGWFESDPVKMKAALHPNLMKASLRAMPGAPQTLQVMSAEQLIVLAGHNQKIIKGTKMHDDFKILYQDGTIAVAYMSSTNFYDVINLMKINGEWKIVQVAWDFTESYKKARQQKSSS